MDAQFLNPNPLIGDHQSNIWKTINGYQRQARKVARCLRINSRYVSYHRSVVISIDDDLTINQHKQLWSQLSRKLRQSGVIAFWSREITTKNRLHYHLITADRLPDEVYTAIRSAVIRVHVELIRRQDDICWYIVKASSSYKHVRKRRYFAYDNSLSKVGTIGKFWFKPMKAIWQDVVDREKMIATYHYEVEHTAYEIHDLINGYRSFSFILRRLASQAMEREERKKRGVICRKLSG